jgi:hypothetical protein
LTTDIDAWGRTIETDDEVVGAGPAAGDEYEPAVQRPASGGDSTAPIEELIVCLSSGGDGGSLSNKLIAAQHDDWQELASRKQRLVCVAES